MTFGREFLVRAELHYLGGTVPQDVVDALAVALRREGEVELSTPPQVFGVIVAEATVRATSSADAVGQLNAWLDRALLATGLFEECDATGKVLLAMPRELGYRTLDGMGGRAR